MNRDNLRTLAGMARRGGRDLLWEVYGRTIRPPVILGYPRSVVFVCKGNICRSPFAERLAARILRERRSDMVLDSAGLEVPGPRPSPREAREAAAGFGVDIEGHLSKPFSIERHRDFDMIAVMETGQWKRLARDYPALRQRLFLLPLFEDQARRPGGYERCNLVDPYGQDLAAYRRCFQRIERCLAGLATRIGAP